MIIPKKIAAIHDIAGFGRSSLTVVIPVMSALGHQTCPVPTAVLSTITGFYTNYTMLDLSPVLHDYLSHWLREGVKLDCIYSGFLGSAEQADIAIDFIDKLHTPLVVVDPVFADGNALYSCFDSDIIPAMKALISRADIITPNATEAAYLVGVDSVDNIESACKCAQVLSEHGPSSVIITGVPDESDKVSIVVFDKKENGFYKISNPYLAHANYPGTGDLFTSVLTAHILKGKAPLESAAIAADFVFMSIKDACESKAALRDGVPFEPMLPRLADIKGLEVKRILL
ncbi:MAG: pyridoxamine kinase [Clostridia bacterium]|nr:pyridoxamine kinase [Clostridia bacterium]